MIKICAQCKAPLVTVSDIKSIKVFQCEKCADEIYDNGVRDGRQIPEKDGE